MVFKMFEKYRKKLLVMICYIIDFILFAYIILFSSKEWFIFL